MWAGGRKCTRWGNHESGPPPRPPPAPTGPKAQPARCRRPGPRLGSTSRPLGGRHVSLCVRECAGGRAGGRAFVHGVGGRVDQRDSVGGRVAAACRTRRRWYSSTGCLLTTATRTQTAMTAPTTGPESAASSLRALCAGVGLASRQLGPGVATGARHIREASVCGRVGRHAGKGGAACSASRSVRTAAGCLTARSVCWAAGSKARAWSRPRPRAITGATRSGFDWPLGVARVRQSCTCP